jgi:hypothetical protein
MKKDLIADFLINGTLNFNEGGVKSIDFVEIYLEPMLVRLEPVNKRFGAGNTPILVVFYSFRILWEQGRDLMGKVISGINRVRQTRSGVSESRVGISS